MKTIIVNDCPKIEPPSEGYNLATMNVKDCSGCFSCWKKTPGKCIFHDLDAFYHDYLSADIVVFFVPITKGVISGRLKTLFDRMIPLFLPYTSWKTGESMHVPRYERYLDIKVFYSDNFESSEDTKLFYDFLYRVFFQFHSKNIMISPMKSGIFPKKIPTSSLNMSKILIQ